jgi:hypothetical protein
MGGALEASNEEALEDGGGQSYWGECLGMNTQGLMQLALVFDGPFVLCHVETSEAWPSGNWLESDLFCFDEDKPGRKSDSLWDTHVGDVHQLVGSPGGGLWLWSVTEAPS